MTTTSLLEISLTRFRSHTRTRLQLQNGPVVLFGPNGAGKTNILDAISLLAPGRGMRRAPYAQAMQHGSDQPWAIHAKLKHPDGQFDIGTALEQQGEGFRRIVRVDGSASTAGALARLVRQVWLTPDQDRIFSGARGLRLKYYDRLVFSMTPDHARAVRNYEKAMRDRQRLLDEDRLDPAWLDALENQMAEHGAQMADNRQATLLKLAAQIEARANSAFPQSTLELQGGDMLAVCGERPMRVFADNLREGFAGNRHRDGTAGRTLAGPHKADLAVTWKAKNMPAADCSTGEQKALLVGLALAHARAVCEDRDSPPPLILLDEACAHLDESRRSALIEELCLLEGQSWLSGTDRSLFETFGPRAQFIDIAQLTK